MIKVVCIEPAGPLVKGDIYTVTYEDDIRYELAEVSPPPEYRGFWKRRFRMLEEEGDSHIEDYIKIDEVQYDIHM